MNQPIVTKDFIITEFHKLLYSHYHGAGFKNVVQWRNMLAAKTPSDMMIYAEIIFNTKPTYIIECGTGTGGSSLFFSDMLKLFSPTGKLITIDKYDVSQRPELQTENIIILTGNSVEDAIIEKVKALIKDSTSILVNLDSDHYKDHVLKELELYAPLVTLSNYLIVEDTNLNNPATNNEFGEGPSVAVKQFLSTHPEFMIDITCERHLISFNPGGYLKKIK